MTLTGPVEAEAGRAATGVVCSHVEGGSDAGRTAPLVHIRLTGALPVVPTFALLPGVTALFRHRSSLVTTARLASREAKVTTLAPVTLPTCVAVQTHALTGVKVTV